ncbi:hypothetical protein LEP1GSC071_1413 [Leptospira santarosai str. JET]|uniref:Uncharacterized protein n=1 Tax=Leptospira santarosai serovar Shermani str. LT 821 TaxID=758847 RepID=K8XYQ5_9LEPT|nr:hypothetical protein LEP1GSC071_1413 [Leptospira santarosai str. JET]EKT86568.1 hypothetical protein LSS_11820 [Leptospira santarosai serovar Shermani str. LT 821]EPG83185.1 hypothetical protein LEP1GSC048_1505 [Leptospira santarosai serovar Shermani str. 1342KT]
MRKYFRKRKSQTLWIQKKESKALLHFLKNTVDKKVLSRSKNFYLALPPKNEFFKPESIPLKITETAIDPEYSFS